LSVLSVCNFGIDLLWPNGWMDQDATALAMEAGLGPGDIVLDGDPAPLTKRGTAAPHFRGLRAQGPMSIVAKRSPISATAERLLQQLVLGLPHKPRYTPCIHRRLSYRKNRKLVSYICCSIFKREL